MEGIGNTLAQHLKALDYRAQRQNVLASNLANADTPGYKAADLTFPDQMRAAQGAALPMAATHAGHVSMPMAGPNSAVVYRRPSQQSIDSNTVDTQQEMAIFTDNSLKMEAALKGMSHEIKLMNISLEN
jgi:flagellar basal-body rod protein FlgB